MGLYTERHGLREPIKKTYDISIKAYSLLFDCCSRYWDNLAWKYPEECPDGNNCCGIDWQQFNQDLEFEIPTLFRRSGQIDKPSERFNAFSSKMQIDEFDQYALFDLIEFVGRNIRDITKKTYHSFYRHNDLFFGNTNSRARYFLNDINDAFEKTGLLYRLTTNFEVERIEEDGVLSDGVVERIREIKEPGLKELMQTAIQKHKSPYPSDQHDAVKIIWDAFERLKSYYATSKNEKRQSIDRILQSMSHSNEFFYQLFNNEMKLLTDEIGNSCSIRHSEVYQSELIDDKYYDYFFNRCLSFIALAIQYLD